MICDTCGTNVNDGAACPTCNKSVSMPVAAASALQSDVKACPLCAETIRSSALRCRFCGGDLTEAVLTRPPGSGVDASPQRAGAAGIAVSAPLRDAGRDQPSIIIQNVQTVAAGAVPARMKSPGLAAVLSFCFTGLGQFYNGDMGKGLLFIFAQAVNLALMFFAIGFFTAFVTWVYGIVDAHNSAVRINARGY